LTPQIPRENNNSDTISARIKDIPPPQKESLNCLNVVVKGDSIPAFISIGSGGEVNSLVVVRQLFNVI
jgi:hypothetical protein